MRTPLTTWELLVPAAVSLASDLIKQVTPLLLNKEETKLNPEELKTMAKISMSEEKVRAIVRETIAQALAAGAHSLGGPLDEQPGKNAKAGTEHDDRPAQQAVDSARPKGSEATDEAVRPELAQPVPAPEPAVGAEVPEAADVPEAKAADEPQKLDLPFEVVEGKLPDGNTRFAAKMPDGSWVQDPGKPGVTILRDTHEELVKCALQAVTPKVELPEPTPEPEAEAAQNGEEGIHVATRQNGKWIVLDPNGKPVEDAEYDEESVAQGAAEALNFLASGI